MLTNLANVKRIAQGKGILVTDLYAGPKRYAGLDGEESVFTTQSKSQMAAYQFSGEWSTAGRAGDVLAPSTEVSASAGSAHGHSPAMLLTYWQAVCSSLRFR